MANLIRSRGRKRKLTTKSFDLQLTSMMDILVIIVVFLLKTYSVSQNSFVSVPGIKLPYSNSLENPPDSLQVIVTPEAITFESERILDFLQTEASVGSTEATYSFKPQDLDEGGRRIVPLYDALLRAKDKADILRAKSTARDSKGNPLPFDGVLAIQADKRVTYDTIRRIMYTAATAEYRTFRFLAMRRDE